MPQLTPDAKRTVSARLGYRLLSRGEDDDRCDLIGPDGRHRGVFRPSRATDLWIWNDAVFSFELYRDREGAVHKGRRAGPGDYALERVWPDAGGVQDVPTAALGERYERLSASQAI